MKGNEGHWLGLRGIAEVSHHLVSRFVEDRAGGQRLDGFSFKLIESCSFGDISNNRAWMKMPACLLAGFKAYLAHIDSSNIPVAYDRFQARLSFNRSQCHCLS